MTATTLPTDEEALLALQVKREADQKQAETRAEYNRMLRERSERLEAEAKAVRIRAVAVDPVRIAAAEFRDVAGDRFAHFAQMLARIDLKRFAAAIADILSQEQGQARKAAILQGHHDREPEREQHRVLTAAQTVLARLGLEE